jgi:integrase/recombinase XerD
MYQASCPSHATDDRPDEAPFADERGRYLRHCAEHGAKAAVLKVKRNELRWIATRLDLNARDGVDMAMLSRITQERQPSWSGYRRAKGHRYWTTVVAVPWLVARAHRHA